MSNEPEDKFRDSSDSPQSVDDESSDDGDQEERPTVAPPFDPVAFAQEVLGGKPSPAAGIPAVKPAGPGDHAVPPGRKTPLGVGRQTPPGGGRHTPLDPLSLANSRVPSNIPPKKQSTAAFSAVDREWEELATSPPPPMQQDLIDQMSRGDQPPSTKDAPGISAMAALQPSALPSVPPPSMDPEVGQGGYKTAPPPPMPPPPAAPSAQEMNDRVSLGDYTGALAIAEKLLALDPDDEPVKICAESCRGVLKQMYTTRIGPLDRVPIVMVARDQLRWLSIDHRAGFVLSLVDGVSSLEMILDVSGMAELDALRILSELAQQRIISFR